ncbi:MAG: AAA family ATPase [Armatimonadota bacterium]
MILRQLRVQGVRCFRNPVSIGPFGDGLNIIFAPNESGKSTLVEAVARALFDRYSVTGERIDSMRPWNTRLAPEIELIFESTSKRYQLRKRFLSDQTSMLYEFRGNTPQLLAERDQADDMMRDLIKSEAPGRGASSAKHWGIARTLWCLQGPGTEATIEVSEGVASQLRQALTGSNTVCNSPVTDIQVPLERLYAMYFTETGRQKKDSPLLILEGRINELDEQYREVRRAYEAAQQAAESLQQINLEIERLMGNKEKCQQSIIGYQQEAITVGNLRNTVATLQKDVERIQADFKSIDENLSSYRDADIRLQDLSKSLERIKKNVSEAITNRKASDKLLKEAKDDYEKAQSARKAADVKWRNGQKVNEALRLVAQIASLEQQLNEVDKLDNKYREKEQEVRSTPCPTERDIENAQQLQQQIKEIKAQLSAVGLTANVDFVQDVSIMFQDGQMPPAECNGKAGISDSFNAGISLGIDIPGILNIRVTSGAQEPASLHEQLQQHEEELHGLFTTYGATNETDLIKQQLGCQAKESELGSLRDTLIRALHPHKTQEGIRDLIAAAKRSLTTCGHELQIQLNDILTLAKVDEADLEKTYKTEQSKEEQLKETLEKRQKQLDTDREAEEAQTSQQGKTQSDIEREKAILDTVLKTMQCADIQALQARVQASREALQKQRNELTQAEAQLPAPEADPERLLNTAQAALAEIEGRERDLNQQLHRQQFEIEHAQTEGRYERMSMLEEELTTNRRAFDRMITEAQALKLLRQILRERKDESVSNQLPGLSNAVTRMLKAITARPRNIILSPDFGISGIHDEGCDVIHEKEEMSGGTREQLDLVLRIALGEAYADEYGRTMMVLDDALLYTDPSRHDRIKEILKIASQKLQIFILTSHQDRYRGIVEREFLFDLLDIVNNAATQNTPLVTA